MDLHPTAEPRRLYDGGTTTEPPDPDREALVQLDRVVTGGRERFRLGRRIAYRDEVLGELLVPGNLETFTTDLTSVPALFAWLVPRTGNHLIPALVHDGLVHPVGTPATYVSSEGHVVDRVQADRVLRNAMRDTHTPTIRRWLVWSAVSLATIWAGSSSWSRATHARYRIPAVLTIVLVVVLGVLATLDLVDVVAVLPWMGADRVWWVELVGGLCAAVVVPFTLGLTWGRFWVAGVVISVALAVLLHVTVALAVLTAAYTAAERALRTAPVLVAVLAGAIVTAASGVTLVLVAGTLF